jgi:ABC-type Fe3+ transport system permease subunit
MAARKSARRTTRKSSPRRRRPVRRRKSGTGIGPWQWLILLVSFMCLVASVYLTFFMDRDPAPREESSITEKVRRLAEEHPDAEVFNLEDPEKKN